MRDPRIEKYVVLIASGGRTGTMFFAEVLGRWIPEAFSVHEPDVVHVHSLAAIRNTAAKVRRFGLFHMAFGRLARRTGIRVLGERYLAGDMCRADLADRLIEQRRSYYASVATELVVEANYQWYSVLPALKDVFQRYRVVGIVRDPRPWVRSGMRPGGHHGPRDVPAKLGMRRLNPVVLGDRAFAARWPTMSPFERLCWEWKLVTERLLAGAACDSNVRVFRYEDLFLGRDRAHHLSAMLDFMTTFAERRFRYGIDESFLERRINAASGHSLPEWQAWPPARARALEEICGPLMGRLGYGAEAEWAAMVDRADGARTIRRGGA